MVVKEHLAPIYHQYLIDKLKLDLPSCVINIGGISNITYYNKDELIGFDSGPGNVLINDYIYKKLGKEFDLNGHLASKGKFDLELVNFFKDSFLKMFPKSADRLDFHFIFENKVFKKLKVEDALATLTLITASIVESLNTLPQKPLNIIISGGGKHNKFLIKTIDKLTRCSLILADHLNINGNFMEAELMAYLAARSIKKLPITFPLTTGVRIPLSGGDITLP